MDIKLDTTDPFLVVNAVITTDTTKQIVKLFKTSDFYNAKIPEPINDARVTIRVDSNIILLSESLDSMGIYATPPDFYGEIGKTYYL